MSFCGCASRFTTGGCPPVNRYGKPKVIYKYMLRKAFPGIIHENIGLEVKWSCSFCSTESFLRNCKRMASPSSGKNEHCPCCTGDCANSHCEV